MKPLICVIDLMHPDDFLTEILSKYRLNHGYSFNFNGAYLSHVIFEEESRKRGWKPHDEELSIKEINGSPLDEIIKLGNCPNILIKGDNYLVQNYKVETLAEFENPSPNILLKKNKLKIVLMNKYIKGEIGEIRKNIKEYLKKATRGFEDRISPPIILGISRY